MVTEMKREEPFHIIDSPKVFGNRMRNLQELRKNRTFCDVVLQVENCEIFAHRSVLACASPYFFELFTAEDGIKTASEDKLIYKLNGSFEKESIEKLVSYAYTGELEAYPVQTKSLYIAASILKMEDIARSCGEFLVASLTPETCLEVRAIPGIASDQHLVGIIDNYIQQHSDVLNVSNGALDVPQIMLDVIHGSKDEAGIKTRALCELAFEWVKKQIEDEELLIEQLTDKTHLLYLNLDNSLHDCADIETGAANDSEMVQDYKKISRKLSQPTLKTKRKSTCTAPQPVKPRMMLFSRSISDENEVVGGDWKLISSSRVSDNSVIAIVTLNNKVTVLSIKQVTNIVPDNNYISRPPSVEKVDCYTLIPPMRSPKCGSGVGTIDGTLIVCGGYDRGECLIDVECYNPETNSWISMPDMLQARGRFDLTVIEDKVFVVGGCNGSRELDSVELYHKNSSTWSEVAPLSLARSNTGVSTLGGKVYCIGGWNGQFGIKQCDVYDPEKDQWEIIEPLHTGRYQAGVSSLNGKVYVVGGCDSWNCLNSMEFYDPQQGVWRHAAPMNTPRRGCGLAALNGFLYVVGGSDGTHSLCTTEIYDPESNTWSSGPSMTFCRANVGVAVLHGRIYAVGGFSGKTFLNTVEFLDPQTNEWTTFTPKPEHFQAHLGTDHSNSNGRTNGLSREANGFEDESDVFSGSSNGSIPINIQGSYNRDLDDDMDFGIGPL